MLNRIFTSLFAAITIMTTGLLNDTEQARGDELPLELSSQHRDTNSGTWKSQTRNEQWKAAKTAVIVCDVWDKHNCLNAVRRLD